MRKEEVKELQVPQQEVSLSIIATARDQMDIQQKISLFSKSGNDPERELKASHNKRGYIKANQPQFKRKQAWIFRNPVSAQASQRSAGDPLTYQSRQRCDLPSQKAGTSTATWYKQKQQQQTEFQNQNQTTQAPTKNNNIDDIEQQQQHQKLIIGTPIIRKIVASTPTAAHASASQNSIVARASKRSATGLPTYQFLEKTATTEAADKKATIKYMYKLTMKSEAIWWDAGAERQQRKMKEWATLTTAKYHHDQQH